jgi:hypothetical protein
MSPQVEGLTRPCLFDVRRDRPVGREPESDAVLAEQAKVSLQDGVGFGQDRSCVTHDVPEARRKPIIGVKQKRMRARADATVF